MSIKKVIGSSSVASGPSGVQKRSATGVIPPVGEYYISTTGNDGNPGTLAQPWATIAHAFSTVTAGSTVILLNGTYREFNLTPTNSGTAGNPICLQGESKAGAIVNASEIVTGWTVYSGTTYQKAAWNYDSCMVWVDGVRLGLAGENRTYRGLLAEITEDSETKDTLSAGKFIYETGTGTMYIRLADDSDPAGHTVEISKAGNIFDLEERDYITLKDLTVCKNGSTAEVDGIKTGNYSTIDNCIVEQVVANGITLNPDSISPRHDVSIQNCTIQDCGILGIYVNNDHGAAVHYVNDWDAPDMNSTITGNYMTENNWWQADDANHAANMKCIPNVRGLTVTNNTIHNVYGAGIWIDGGIGENTVTGNTVSCTNKTIYGREGIFIEITRDALGTPSVPLEFGTKVENNLLYDLKRAIYIAASNDCEVYRNTCYNCNQGIRVHGMPRQDGPNVYTLYNNRIEYNIFTRSTDDSNDQVAIIWTGTNSGDNIINHNYYHTATPPEAGNCKVHVDPDGIGGGVTYSGLAALQAATTYEDNGVEGDAAFVNPAGGDYRADASIRDTYGYQAVASTITAVPNITGAGSDSVNPLLVSSAQIFFVQEDMLGQTSSPGTSLKDSFLYAIQTQADNKIILQTQPGAVWTYRAYWAEGNTFFANVSGGAAIYTNLWPNIGWSQQSNVFMYRISTLNPDNRLWGDGLDLGAYDPVIGWTGVTDLLSNVFLIEHQGMGSSDEVLDIGRGPQIFRVIRSQFGGGNGSNYAAIVDLAEHYTDNHAYNPPFSKGPVIFEDCVFWNSRQRMPNSRCADTALLNCVIFNGQDKYTEFGSRSSGANNPYPYSSNLVLENNKYVVGPNSSWDPFTDADRFVNLDQSSSDPYDGQPNQYWLSANEVWAKNAPWYPDGQRTVSSQDDLHNDPDDPVTGTKFIKALSRPSFISGVTAQNQTVAQIIAAAGPPSAMQGKPDIVSTEYENASLALYSSWSSVPGGYPVVGLDAGNPSISTGSVVPFDITGAFDIMGNGATRIYNTIFGL